MLHLDFQKKTFEHFHRIRTHRLLMLLLIAVVDCIASKGIPKCEKGLTLKLMLRHTSDLLLITWNFMFRYNTMTCWNMLWLKLVNFARTFDF